MTDKVDAAREALREFLGDIHGFGDDTRVLSPSMVETIMVQVDAIRAESEATVAGLREALVRLDDAWRWVEKHYPKLLVEMPSLAPFNHARAALAATPEVERGIDPDDPGRVDGDLDGMRDERAER